MCSVVASFTCVWHLLHEPELPQQNLKVKAAAGLLVRQYRTEMSRNSQLIVTRLLGTQESLEDVRAERVVFIQYLVSRVFTVLSSVHNFPSDNKPQYFRTWFGKGSLGTKFFLVLFHIQVPDKACPHIITKVRFIGDTSIQFFS